jgi:TonB family protein
VRLAAAALLVEARFGELLLASKLLHADRPDVFTIGPRARADAPVNPAYLDGAWHEGHALVEVADGGFALRLAPAMRVELETPVQRLALAADVGRVEAPLALPPDACLRVPCGEMTFELRAAEPLPAMPKPWLAAGWREEGRYTLGVALALLLAVVVVGSIPSDPKSLSLEEIGVPHRYLTTRILPPEIPEPPPDKGTTVPGGGGSKAAAGPSGQAGTPTSKKVAARLSVAGNSPKTAEQAAARVKESPVLLLLDGARGGDLAKVISDEHAMGSDVKTVMGNMRVGDLADAYGVGGMGQYGTGSHGAGEGDGLIAGNGLGTIGDVGRGGGVGPGYGRGVGHFGRRVAKTPDVIPGTSLVRGSLDKEIIRRIVRRHINEVRYCYDQALALKPTLGGRVVVRFTIAPAGNVLASVLASSTLGSVAVESCVVNAVKRWEFPKPEGGGLVIVSYPFQLTPAGG